MFVYAEDFTVFGGSLGRAVADKICKLMDLAMEVGAPIIGLKDSGGARIQEGVASLDGYGRIFERNVRASGVIPQISVIMGPCAGGAVYSPAITDFVIQVDKSSHMFITGPDVIKAVTGEEVSFEELGGALTHASTSGVTHFVFQDGVSALDGVRYMLSFLPSEQPRAAALLSAPRQPRPNRGRPRLAHPRLLQSTLRHGFADRVGRGRRRVLSGPRALGPKPDRRLCPARRASVGIVANQPAILAGTLDIKASEKGARFVRFCDSFNIPIVTFVDVPGFLPGVDQEHGGIIRHGAKLLYAYCEATVPRMSVIVRKAYGGAYLVMNARGIRADMVFAWPSAEIAVMGAQGAVNVIFRREIQEAARRRGQAVRVDRGLRGEVQQPLPGGRTGSGR